MCGWTVMQLRKTGLLVLSLLIIGWVFPTAAQASTQTGDVQQSTYSVTLTPPSSGGDGDLITSPSHSHNNSGGAGATVTQTANGSSQPVSTSHGLTGRLPQTSETGLGLGVMTGIILMLLVWIGFLKTRKNKKIN